MEPLDTDQLKSAFSSLLKAEIVPVDNHSNAIDTLLQQFPYCQPLYAIRAIQNKTTPLFSSHLSKAATYASNRVALYNLIHQKEFISTPIPFPKSVEKMPILEITEMVDETIEETYIEETLFINDIETVIPEREAPALEENSRELKSEYPQEPIFDTLASSDYFKFNKSTADPLAKTVEETEIDSSQVSKYDDDTMPYSFLWWLHKTRKEHADTYQPYVNFTLDTNQRITKSPAEELNHQIIENIFHLQVPISDTPEKTISSNTVQFEIKRKEDDIIEKFIQEEPQIRPPKPEMIDTENKARKSSEDNLDLVSETLATIYIEQMLYHKAIDTYQKLSLKFPEKSTYFAGQITELQKKIN